MGLAARVDPVRPPVRRRGAGGSWAFRWRWPPRGTGLAFALAARRDQGAGLLPDRPGRATASAFLSGPFGLTWRLQRGALLGWATGYAFTFAACGAAAKGIGQLFGTSTALEREFTRLGGLGAQAAITNAYLAALMLLAGLVAAAYAISVVLRLRTEETGETAEPVLATATGRIRWALSHIAMAVAGAALLLAVAGVTTGLGYGLRAGSAGSEVARMTGAALAQLPSVLVLAAIAVLVFGLLPRASVPAAWTALGLVVLINLFGQVLQLSHWVLDISPFTHAPRLPGGTVPAAPLVWLCALALAAAVSRPGRPAPPRHRLSFGNETPGPGVICVACELWSSPCGWRGTRAGARSRRPSAAWPCSRPAARPGSPRPPPPARRSRRCRPARSPG